MRRSERRPGTKRVGLVCHFPPPPGGMPVQALAFERGFEREGWQVRRVETSLRGGRIITAIDGLRFIRTFARWPVYMVRLLLAVPRVDVVHVMSYSGVGFFLFTAPAIALGKCFGRPVVVHYHSGAAPEFLRAWGRLVVPLLRAADALVVPSGFLRDVFAKVGLGAEIVPNVGDWSRFGGHPGPVEPTLLVARQLQPIYRIDTAIRAFARVRQAHADARLLIAGDGPERHALEQLCRALGVEDAVQFLGDVPNDQMPAVYRRASIALNPSSVDNVPISILEAFAAGLPVVTTDAGGISYMVVHGSSGLLGPVGDDDQMARHVVSLLEDPRLAERLRERGRQAVQTYSWAHAFQALSKLAAYAPEPSAVSPIRAERCSTASVTVERHSWLDWDRIACDWEGLVQRSANASFYVSRDWVDAWLSVFGESLQPDVLTFHGDGRLVGACLLVARHQWVRGIALRRLYLNCSGEDEADSPCIEHNALLAEPGFEEAVNLAFAGNLDERRWDELLMDGAVADSGRAGAVQHLGAVEAEERGDPYVDLAAIRGGGKSLLGALPKKTRHHLRRTMKYYAKMRGSGASIERAETLEQALEYLDELVALHSAVWRQRGQAGAFASGRFTEFHRNLVATAFPHGAVALLRTRVGDETIGVIYAFVFGGRVHAYQTGFRYTADNRPSPGLLSHYLAIDHFLDTSDVWEYDFGAGEADYKRALSTSSRVLRWVVVRRRTAAEIVFLGARAVKRRYARWAAPVDPDVPMSA